MLSVYVSREVYVSQERGNRPSTPVISTPLDLAATLGSNSSLAGFTAGTGLSTANQDILSWQLNGSLAATSYRQTILASDPFAYWPLDETNSASPAVDIIGGLNGHASSTVTRGVEGAVDGRPAARLRSFCDGIRLDFSADALAPRNAFTAEAWIKLGKPPGGRDAHIFGWRKGGWRVRLHNKHLQLVVNTEAGQQYATTGAILEDKKAYHHIAVTKDQNNVVLYFDGRPEVGGVLTTNIKIEGQEIIYPQRMKNRQVAIGPPFADSCEGFNGNVDEVALYMRALTPAAILGHYDSARHISPRVTGGRTGRLLSEWRRQ
jgi:hypothetical protein